MNSEVMNRLGVKQTLSEAELVISQADGSQMKIEEKNVMSYKGRRCGSKSHPIHGSRVVCGTNLREDWLKAQKARLEFVLTKLILGKVEVPLGGNENNTFVVVQEKT